MGSFSTRLRGVVKGNTGRRGGEPWLVGGPGTAQETTWAWSIVERVRPVQGKAIHGT